MTLMSKHQDILAIEDKLYQYFKPKSIDKILGLEKMATDFCCSLILDYFHEMNFSTPQGEKFSIEKLISALSAVPKYHKMLRLFSSILHKNGFLENRGQELFFTELAVKRPTSEGLLKKIAAMHPKYHAYFSFVDSCVRRYPKVLSGEIPGVRVLFPSGNSSQLARIYQETPKIGHEDLYLNLLRETLMILNESNTKLQVLEIGAGQGILTEILIPSMISTIGHYFFTDISQAFVNQGKSKFNLKAPETMRFATYDVTLPPEQQGVKPESFDVIVSFNVLHATADVGKSLENAAGMLKKNGYIFLVENIKQQIWVDMIYGLTDGWWAYDDGVREISPLLTAEQWRQILKKSGFDHSIVLPEQRAEVESVDTSLIIIQKV